MNEQQRHYQKQYDALLTEVESLSERCTTLQATQDALRHEIRYVWQPREQQLLWLSNLTVRLEEKSGAFVEWPHRLSDPNQQVLSQIKVTMNTLGRRAEEAQRELDVSLENLEALRLREAKFWTEPIGGEGEEE